MVFSLYIIIMLTKTGTIMMGGKEFFTALEKVMMRVD
jgi:hypothetical protein